MARPALAENKAHSDYCQEGDGPQNRRCGMDRRKFSYTRHIPERRLGRDRRSENRKKWKIL